MTIASPVLSEGGSVPKRFTCKGAGDRPPLHWSGVPSGARELVLLVEDPDAPGGTFVHWTVFGMAPDGRSVPAGAAEGENSAGKRGWQPPCPPPGDAPHRYRFLLYALGAPSRLEAGAEPDDVHAALDRARPLARGVLEVRFGR
jgi:Raf kinase inhibitor-like YbhB/YbcL family protein